jgi:hypothetical protein
VEKIQFAQLPELLNGYAADVLQKTLSVVVFNYIFIIIKINNIEELNDLCLSCNSWFSPISYRNWMSSMLEI